VSLDWSARRYSAFEAERTRPVRDLLAAVPGTVPGAVRVAVDLGCGPGNSTEALLERFPGAVVTGIDSSPDMVAAAEARLPGVGFAVGDLQDWDGAGPFDLILSNAVLHWVPDHGALLPRLAGKLAPGGSLAVQMPDNLEEPAHRLMRAVAAEGPWAAALADAAGAQTARATPGAYYAMLRAVCGRVDVWRTTYHHVLTGGADAVVEWFLGSGLRPFLNPLGATDREEFLAEYWVRIAAAFPALPDGSVLLPFPRLFIVATR